MDDARSANETGIATVGGMLLDSALRLEEQSDASSAERAEAWQEFATHARENPKAALRLLVEMMLLYAKAGQGALAELLATKALTLDEHHPDVLLVLAKRYSERGLHPQALKLVGELVDQAGDQGLSPAADHVLALSSWRSGDMEQARAAFFRLANATQKGEAGWEEARTTVEFFKAESDRPTLRMLLESLSERKSDDPELCLWMAEWLIEDLDDKRAEDWLQRALDHSDAGSELAHRVWRVRFALSHPEDAESYRKLTIGIFHNSPEEARKGLEDILSRHPDFTEARYFLGTCYRRMRMTQDAVACFEQVVNEQHLPNAYLELGALYGELGDPEKALEICKKADEVFEGTNHVVVCNMAAALLELGQLDESAAAIERAREMRPNAKVLARLDAALAAAREGKGKRKGCLGRLFGG